MRKRTITVTPINWPTSDLETIRNHRIRVSWYE